MGRTFLLICGFIAPLLYIGADILAASTWNKYSYTSHTVSELMAIEAPTRPLLYYSFLIHNFLLVAFGAAIWATPGRKVSMRATAALLIIYGIQGSLGLNFPMHSRGVEAAITTTDMMHIVFTITTVLCILLFIGFGAFSHGIRFRWFSVGALGVIIVFGILGGLQGPRVAENLPTPWLGAIERVNIYATMLWLMVFALVCIRTERTQRRNQFG